MPEYIRRGPTVPPPAFIFKTSGSFDHFDSAPEREEAGEEHLPLGDHGEAALRDKTRRVQRVKSVEDHRRVRAVRGGNREPDETRPSRVETRQQFHQTERNPESSSPESCRSQV
jgi:hypothetical protein